MQVDTKTLYLHFDVNKTVIMLDPVQNKGPDAIVNEILADFTHGRVIRDPQTGEAIEWIWDGRPPRGLDDWIESDPYPEPEGVEGGSVVSYYAFVKARHPGPSNKSERSALTQSFTQPGHPGERLQHIYDRLRGALRLPDHLVGTPEAAAVGLTTSDHFMLPSFLNLLRHLHASSVPFKLIFRTFGKDVETVTREFNAFCDGRHPLITDDSMAMPHRRIDLSHPHGLGAILRTDDDDVHLIMGTDGESFEHPHTRPRDIATVRTVATRTASGVRAIHEALKDMLADRPTIFIRDDYVAWRDAGEHEDHGKVFPIDASGEAHCMFFDDNVDDDGAHIVDARDACTGEKRAFEDVVGVHVVRVLPHLAIIDDRYYEKLLEQSLRRMNGTINGT